MILQECHKGLVSARKLGVERARGKYCIFVDSDDWIDKNLLNRILPLTNDGSIDVVNFSLKSVNGNQYIDWKYTIPDGLYENHDLEKIYKKMVFDFKCGHPGIIQSLCTKLIDRVLLWESIKSVDNRITMAEDAAVTYNIMLNAKKIVIVSDFLYFYRIRGNSMCLTKDIELFSKIYYFQQYMHSIFSVYNRKYKLNEQLQAYLIHFIEKGISDVYSIKMKNLYHISVHLSDLTGKIVLYGAGSVGKSFYRQLQKNQNVKIVSWVDKGLEKQKIYDQVIESPDILNEIKFDKILIAVRNKCIAEEIRIQLLEYNSNAQILWSEPYVNWWEKEIDF